jgi:nitroimidazol reductase NimA-like FMN-containing flavoprotein (pyridoxamine 5'-phosphate oxidase superfamily)
MPLLDDGLEILSEEECRALLGQGRVGRVAITFGALPAVLPVNYSLLDGAIVFLTGEGTKLRAALKRAVVAFEVDEIDVPGRRGWSVLAVGMASEITDEDELARARQLNLRPLAGGDRSHFVQVRPQLLSGRRIADETTSRADVPNGVVSP